MEITYNGKKETTEELFIDNKKIQIICNEKEHPTEKVILDGKEVDIDIKIIELVKCLNKYGIRTEYSCQGDKVIDGYVSIIPENCELIVSNGIPKLVIRFKEID